MTCDPLTVSVGFLLSAQTHLQDEMNLIDVKMQDHSKATRERGK